MLRALSARLPAGSLLAGLCLLAVWAPCAVLLGTEAPVLQGLWAAWCVACMLLLARAAAAGTSVAAGDAFVPDAGEEAVRNLPLAICACAVPDGHILFANDAMLALSGEAKRDLHGRTLSELCADDRDRQALSRALAAAGDSEEMKVAVRRGDGSVRVLSVAGRMGTYRGQPAMYFACRDITEADRMQDALAASEARFRSLLEALSDAVVLYDAGARVLTCNEAAEGQVWLNAGLPEGNGDVRIWSEQGRVLPQPMHPVMRSLADGLSLREVVIGIGNEHGQMRWLSVTTQPLFHADTGRPYAVVASYADITARIRAERALRASEQRYALALRGMNEGLAEWTDGSDEMYVSPRLSQILGQDAGGRRVPVSDFEAGIHPDDRTGWIAMMADLLAGHQDQFQVELRMQHADGTYRWFLVRGAAQRGKGGRRNRVVGTVSDISVRRRLEQSDLAERELLAQIAAGLPLYDVMTHLAELVERMLDEDSRAVVLTFDPARPGQVDVAAAPGLPESFRDSITAASPPPDVRRLVEGLSISREQLIDDLDALAADEPYRPVLGPRGLRALWALPLIGQGGAVLGCLAICHARPWRPGRAEENMVERLVDIAQLALERARGEREVRALNESLERRVAERTAMLEKANGELEAFSYSVSHDLRSPLRAINGFAHILAEHAADSLDEEGRDMLARIERGATRMGQLIDDILHFSRMSRVEMTHADISLDRLAESVASELHGQYPAARIDIAPIGRTRGDAAMLHQVFANLIGNALKFSSRAEQPRVEVFVDVVDGVPAICVRDNGVGFDPVFADRLFGVFQRMHGADEFPGTGVGLAIVKRVVERHGGSVSVFTAPGKGATFRFTLEGFEPAEQPATRTGCSTGP